VNEPLPPLPPPGAGPVPPAVAPPSAAPAPDPVRKRAALFAALAVAVVLLVALVAALVGPDGEIEAAPTGPTTPVPAPETSAPPGTGAPDTTPGSPDTAAPPGDPLQATVDELMVFVERERGLRFLERPDVVVLDDDAFVDRYRTVLREDFEENAETIAHFSGIYQALGLLPDGVTIEEAYESFGEAAVLGFYMTETGELVVRGGEITPLLRVTILHELVHALDDQHFELYRPEYDDRDDEVSFGFVSLVEGSARWVENRYRAGLSAEELRAITREEMALGQDVDFSNLTMAFVRLQLLPYEAGEAFVGYLLDQGGQEALDAAFEDPPTTSEQVLDPAAYLARAPADEVPPPPADGPVLEDGLFGQAVLQVLMIDAIGTRAAAEAASGWGGDWFVSWDAGGSTCIRTDVQMDTDRDADELEDGLGAWLRGGSSQLRADGEVERLSETLVRFTACS
jgi:hypothetical protein